MTTTRMRRAGATLPLGACLLLALSACGPGSAQALDIRKVDLDIALGREPGLPPGTIVVVPGGSPLPPGGVAIPVNIPVFTLPVQPVVIPTPRALPEPSYAPLPTPGVNCPSLDPRVPSAHDATVEVDDAATNGTYIYRVAAGGTQQLGSGANLGYPVTVTHTIANARKTGTGTFSFDDNWQSPSVAIAATYASTNQDANAAVGLAGQQLSQLGLAKLTLTLPKHTTIVFAPAKPVTVLKTPASAGLTWTDAGSDGVDTSSLSVQGTIVGTDRVNACGAAVDAWKVTETLNLVAATATSSDDPTQLGQQTNMTLTVTRWYATGFGGQLVSEDESWSGTLNGASVTDKHTATTDSPTPQPSASPAP